MQTITPELRDFVHGFTKRCHELGIHDDAQIQFLLSKAAMEGPKKKSGTEQAAKPDSDYYRGAGKLVGSVGEAKGKSMQGGEVNAVNRFTNMGTSENYQRG